MILFLDIDGVLHPADCSDAERFSALPRLVALLREVTFRRVDIVLSAPVLGSFSMGGLRERFPADLRHRMIGAIEAQGEAGAQDTGGMRELEIRRWLACGANNRNNGCRPWLAIDDSTDLYAPDCAHLFAVDAQTGLNAPGVARLRQRLVSDSRLLH